mmetsp:Transcript_48857/g.78069  ORF Transcript_48857/g.78069 Transcript_48857/m.78069 type:complete len:172 (+) Transcript_48857:90-605(+)|eukprot:CAMPEP_0197054774 /NCGR_PEP_ID=MMETSP1384-20130603/49428_1 /TAXON_ID=29189 /ORGANISM="Ammonia sp." /LENGTH=171 /DNA_ID=CAMNT_0042488077 /DNA_START=71 /DNA_END=586 /DNA_ORIENTATION=-
MNKLSKPVSNLLHRACVNSFRMTSRQSLSYINAQRRWFADHSKKGEFSSQEESPHLYDPTYIPTEEKDFDVDPLDVRLRQPLPAECFLERDLVFKRVVAICEGMDRAKTDGVVLTENTHLANDLGLDSLDQVEFGLAVEDEFDVEIPDQEAEQIVTIGDVVEMVSDHPHAR